MYLSERVFLSGKLKITQNDATQRKHICVFVYIASASHIDHNEIDYLESISFSQWQWHWERVSISIRFFKMNVNTSKMSFVPSQCVFTCVYVVCRT